MRMQRIYEWPEIDRNSARHRAKFYADQLAANERGELDKPLSPRDEAEYREHWAELNYLAYGRVKPKPKRKVKAVERSQSADKRTRATTGETVAKPKIKAPPIFAVDEVHHNGQTLISQGDELIGKLEKAKSELAHFERRADRSDIAAYGWTGAIIDANSKIAKIEAAIVLAEQQESG